VEQKISYSFDDFRDSCRYYRRYPDPDTFHDEDQCYMERLVRILIADDKQTARQGLCALLSQFPRAEVVGEAANGQECVALAASCRPDVVLLDIQMPTMDGLEATRRIKSQWPEIRVVILTMYAQYRSAALAAGADIFLLKGCTTQELQESILGSGHRVRI
jgi:DNA-binding NarL/FixJ family response regulator